MSKNRTAQGEGGLGKKLYALLFHCPRGKHSRSFDHVAPDGDRYVSKCHGCGTPMVRLAKRKWVVDDH